MNRLLAICLIVFTVGPLRAEQSLDSVASNPTSAPKSFRLQADCASSLRQSNGSSSNVQFREAIPDQLVQTNNIARRTLPYVTLSGSGAGDAPLFSLTTFDRIWGRFGALGRAKVFMGGDPAKSEVNLLISRVTFGCAPGGGWSVGIPDRTFICAWESGNFTSQPAGTKQSKLATTTGLPVQWHPSDDRNIYDIQSGAARHQCADHQTEAANMSRASGAYDLAKTCDSVALIYT